jgi:hypothetical protein
LEKSIDEDVLSGKQFASGTWYLDDIYDQITAAGDVPTQQEWVLKQPQSSNAKIALASGLTNYAWQARGSGWASSVTDEGWKLFSERLEQSSDMLKLAQKTSPRWYAASQTVALGQSWPSKKYDAMVAEGRKKFPNYSTLVFRKAYWLQPRWHGTEGEAEKYMAAEAAKLPPADRDIFYAQIAWSVSRRIGDVFNETKISWPRTKAGLMALVKKNPHDCYPRYALSSLAMLADDEATASSAFDGMPK